MATLALMAWGAVPALADVTGTFRGRVVEDRNGSGVAAAGIRIYSAGSPDLLAEVETNGDGRFVAADLPLGDLRMEVSKTNFVPITMRLRADPDVPVVLRMIRCGAISGHVTDATGAPVPEALVFALVDANPAAPEHLVRLPGGARSSVDALGQYRLFGLPPGKYAVAVTRATPLPGAPAPSVGGGAQLYPENRHVQYFTVVDGDEFHNVDFSMASEMLSAVKGTVELSKKDTPVQVSLTPLGQPALAIASQTFLASGRFQFNALVPGSYELLFSSPFGGYPRFRDSDIEDRPMFARARVDVAGQNIPDIIVVLREGRPASFLLQARSPSGACPKAATLELTPLEDWSARLNRVSNVSSLQETVVDQLASGQYGVKVSGLGPGCFYAGSPVIDVTAESKPERHVLEVVAAAELRGQLVGLGEAKPEAFAVVLYASETASLATPDGATVQASIPDSRGKFHFDGLRPGKYRVAAQPLGDSPGLRWIDPGRMIELDLIGGSATDLDLPVPHKLA